MTEIITAELNKTKPALPGELLQFPLDDIDILDFPRQLEVLWNEIIEELYDPRWVTRSHNSTGTYDKGCRGPLCRKSVRENARRKSDREDTMTELAYRYLDPIMEYYHLVAKLRLNNYRRERILAIRSAG
jgi:hypothetical protein